jgi:hypothetical protein
MKERSKNQIISGDVSPLGLKSDYMLSIRGRKHNNDEQSGQIYRQK